LSIVPPVISEKAWSLLEQYGWPGNVRQLKNVVQRLVILGMEGITEDTVNLALDMQSQDSMSSFVNPVFTEKNLAPLKEVEHDFRKQYFEYVRKHSKTDTEAAGKLGLAPPNFHRMCKELGLK